MKRKHKQEPGPGPVAMLDDGVRLLRGLPASAWLLWAGGALPFGGLLLYAINRLGWGVATRTDAAEVALLLTAAWFWMRALHFRFCGAVWRQVAAGGDDQPPEPLPLRTRVFHGGLAAVLYAVSALFILPAPWLYPFAENLCIVPHVRHTHPMGEAWRQAVRSPGQSMALLSIAALAGGFLVINWGALLALVPAVVEFVSGAATDWQRHLTLALQGPLVPFAVVLTWLTLDPVLKAAHVLQCFHGLSTSTGEDIRVAWRRTLLPLAVAAVLVLPSLRMDAETPAAQPTTTISEAQLRDALDQTLEQPRYHWRLPPEQQVHELTYLTVLQDAMDEFFDWLRSLLPERKRQASKSSNDEGDHAGYDGPTLSIPPVLVWSILFVLLVVGVIWLLRAMLQARTQPPPSAATGALAEAMGPNIDSDDLSGAELPLNEWVALGDRLLAEGDYRRAARAYFLAHLSLLGERGALRLARNKSNGDYQRDLRASQHVFPGSLDNYAAARRAFEALWYGGRTALADDARALRAMLPDIRRAA